MRLTEVFATRARVRDAHEMAPPAAAMPTGSLDRPFQFARRTVGRRLKDAVAPAALRLLTPVYRRRVPELELPGPVHRVSWADRFAIPAAHAALVRGRAVRDWDVHVQGCWLGDGLVQQWLATGVRSVSGSDVLDLSAYWSRTAAALEGRYGRPVAFTQASADRLPYPDGAFDLVTSAAVYEHVYNLRAAAAESARVLRPGGRAFHSIGPLYFCPSGDHCIGAYGPDTVYDHLLLDEAEYRRRLARTEVFARAGDECAQHWAVKDKLSFARPADYYAAFAPHFEFEFVVVMLAPEAMWFRHAHPDRWAALRAGGLSVTDLTVKSLVMVLRKR